MADLFRIDASDFNNQKARQRLVSHMSSRRKTHGLIYLEMITTVITSRVTYEIVIGGELMGTLSNFYSAVELFNKAERFVDADDIAGYKAMIADKASLEPKVQVAI